MKAAGDLLVGKVLVGVQIENLAVGLRQQRHHLAQEDQHLLSLSESFGGRSHGREFRQPHLVAGAAAHILGGVVDDLLYPRAGLGFVKVGVADRLEDLHPAGLQHIFGEAVIAGDATGQRKEAPGATDNPSLQISFQQRTVFGGLFQLGGGNNVEIIGHPSSPPNLRARPRRIDFLGPSHTSIPQKRFQVLLAPRQSSEHWTRSTSVLSQK